MTISSLAYVQTMIALSNFVNRPLLVLLFVTLVAEALSYQTPLADNLYSPGITLHGFYDLEGRTSATPYRWTDHSAQIMLSGIGRQALRATLTLSSARPSDVDLPKVQLVAGQIPIGSFRAPRPIREFSFDIPPESMNVMGDLDLQVRSETFTPANDLRNLGIALYNMRLETASGKTRIIWPAPLPLVWGMLSIAFCFLTLDRRLPAYIVWLVTLLMLTLICAGLAATRTLTVSVLPLTVFMSILAYMVADILESKTSSLPAVQLR
jgi:hypothetical protein